MKKALRYILFTVAFVLLPLEASKLSIEHLRLQERQLALVDFKNIYKDRQYFNQQLLKRVKYKRTKTVQHNTLFNRVKGKTDFQKSQVGIRNNNAFNGMSGANNSANMPPTGGDNNMPESVGHRPVDPWGKRP